MNTRFYIVLSLKTVSDPEPFATFDIGNDREAAYALFQKLKGTDDMETCKVLFMELMEKQNGLPVNIKMQTCTLKQLAQNCKIIVKELFKTSFLDRNMN